MDSVKQFLRSEQIPFYEHFGITTVTTTEAEGFFIAQSLLLHILTKQTCLFLSGGQTPKKLYELLSTETLSVGAVGMVDERYALPMHEQSNELMLKKTGLLRTLELTDVPFFPILSSRHPDPATAGEGSRGILHSVQNDNMREEIADAYDQRVRQLFASYQKHIALLGIGLDGHTAGIPALSAERRAQSAKLEEIYEKSKSRMVIDFDDDRGFYKERITMTFSALSLMDLLIVLVFGEEKKKALASVFTDGKEEDIPARFFKRPDIAVKTLVITDQIL